MKTGDIITYHNTDWIILFKGLTISRIYSNGHTEVIGNEVLVAMKFNL